MGKILACCVCVSLLGCGRGSHPEISGQQTTHDAPAESKKKPEISEQQPAHDPLAEFKKKVEAVSQLKSRFGLREYKPGDFPEDKVSEQENLENIKAGKNWQRSKQTVNKIAFDVRRTDSLVSPYEATLAFDIVFSISERLSRTNAEQDKCEKILDNTFHYRAIYAYQESRWILKSLKAQWAFPDYKLIEVKMPEWKDRTLESLGWEDLASRLL